VPVFHRACRGAALLPFLICGLQAQTNSLTLSSAAAESGGAVTLDLSLHSLGARPVALQWTFQYPPSDISSIGVDDGPMITSTGKTVMCTGDATAYKCLIVGGNAKAIANGVVARVTAVLAPGIKETTIALRDALGTSANGTGIPISAVAGTITSSKSPQNGNSPETRSRKRHPQPKSEHP
jgi:hypothetical protein